MCVTKMSDEIALLQKWKMCYEKSDERALYYLYDVILGYFDIFGSYMRVCEAIIRLCWTNWYYMRLYWVILGCHELFHSYIKLWMTNMHASHYDYIHTKVWLYEHI